MTESETITRDIERAERRGEEYLPRQRQGLVVTPVLTRRTREEIEADWKERQESALKTFHSQ